MYNESARGNVQEKVTKVNIQQSYAISKLTNLVLNLNYPQNIVTQTQPCNTSIYTLLHQKNYMSHFVPRDIDSNRAYLTQLVT